MPQLRDLILFDRVGQQHFISTYFPSPRINVRDRPYFVALEQGDRAATFGPYIGRNSGRYTYALALLVVLVLAVREISAFSRMARLDTLRAAATRAEAEGDLKSARRVVDQLLHIYRGRADMALSLIHI